MFSNSNPAFSRDLRRDSVPARVMARFIEERQETTTTTTTDCGPVVISCIFGVPGQACFTGVPSPPGTVTQCLINNCPEASAEITQCLGTI